MIVLSLFDGISCGYLALKRLKEYSEFKDLNIDKYYASEIDEIAIKIAKTNNPDIIEIGDVRKIHYNRATQILYTEKGRYFLDHVDLLMGGSPCTDFSQIGYQKGMLIEGNPICTLYDYIEYKKKGVEFIGQSYLFWEYVRLLDEIKPKYFLLENVVMANKWRDIIDTTLNYLSIEINSALVSAQNRRRLYWTNIAAIVEPLDKHIILDQILDADADTTDCSNSSIVQNNLDKLVKKYGYLPLRFNAYNAKEIIDKTPTLTKGSMVSSSCATLIWVKLENGVHFVKDGYLDNKYPILLGDGRYNLRQLSIKEMERLQTLPDDYTNIDGLCRMVKSACIGNAWTVDVIVHILKEMRC